MNKSNITEIVQGISGEVDHFVYRVPKKNHDAMMQLDKKFGDIITKEFGVAHLVFQLSSTEAPMEGMSNIAKASQPPKMRRYGWSYYSIEIVSTKMK